jgi:DNA-binding transcriptional LysR family regulator
MSRKIDWEGQIGRRLKLRDLHVFSTVVQRGSMAKAAAHLGVSQPAVSEVIADIEGALGVRLLDRGPHGVEPTIYGTALLKRSLAAFDELKQGIRDIEYLAESNVGELRIGCVESLASAMLPPVIEQFSRKYPRITFNLKIVTPTLELPELRERSLDVVLVRITRPPAAEDEDLNVQVLFHDELAVMAGPQSPWGCRRKIDLAELVNEQWLLPPSNTWTDMVLKEAFQARGIAMPKAFLTTYSLQFRADLLTTGPFITALPVSLLRLNPDRFSLKVLPVDLPARPWPVAAVTLRNRTLSPIVQRCIDHIGACAKSMAELTSMRPSASRSESL